MEKTARPPGSHSRRPVRASLSARRAIKDALYSAGSLAGAPDAETLRLYERMTTFMDQMLVTTVEAYDLARLQAAAGPLTDVP